MTSNKAFFKVQVWLIFKVELIIQINIFNYHQRSLNKVLKTLIIRPKDQNIKLKAEMNQKNHWFHNCSFGIFYKILTVKMIIIGILNISKWEFKLMLIKYLEIVLKKLSNWSFLHVNVIRKNVKERFKLKNGFKKRQRFWWSKLTILIEIIICLSLIIAKLKDNNKILTTILMFLITYN